MALFWIIMIITLIVLEASTTQFICIWFAGGALGALICELFGLNIWVQSTVFVLLTFVLLLCTKKFVQKLRNGPKERTNADALIGETAIITKAISDTNTFGEAKIQGMVWSARSIDGKGISEGSLVTVEKISGVKLIVKNIKED